MANEKRNKGRPHVFLCGVPGHECRGSVSQTSQSLRGKDVTRVHSSPQEAFKCMSNYLISLGYTKMGSNAFVPSDGGPVRVLTKPSRYGGRLRDGKASTRYMAPRKRGTRAGVIIG